MSHSASRRYVRNPCGWSKGTTVLKSEDIEKHLENMDSVPLK